MNVNIKDSLKFAIDKIKAYYPLHIATMIVAIPLAIEKINNSDLDISTFVIQIVSSILMIRSWIPVHAIANSLNEVAWYLCLYFFLLLITPIAAKIIGKIKFDRKKIVIFVMLLFAVQCTWVLLVWKLDNAYWLIYMNPIIRSVEYLIGMGLGHYMDSGNITVSDGKASRNLFVISVIASIIINMSISNIPSVIQLTLPWTLLSAMLVVLAVDGTACKSLFENRVLIAIGNWSAEIFLIHYLVICYLREIEFIKSMPKLGRLAVYALGCYIFVVLWRKIDSLREMNNSAS